MKIRGRKAHRLVLGAEDRARHRTPGAKRFVHTSLNDRGLVMPNYSMAHVFAMTAVLSIVSRVKARAFRGKNL